MIRIEIIMNCFDFFSIIIFQTFVSFKACATCPMEDVLATMTIRCVGYEKILNQETYQMEKAASDFYSEISVGIINL